MARQHDAHVRARARLLKRIRERWMDWGLPIHMRRYTIDQQLTRIDQACAKALSAHKWREGWENRLSAYVPFPTLSRPSQRVIGQYRDVPASEIHSIMCEASQWL